MRIELNRELFQAVCQRTGSCRNGDGTAGAGRIVFEPLALEDRALFI